ncbi:MAG: RND transporter [Magnetococcales bacterium]|nr:RND transporter [Magnetococcales bacterium]MBF0157015.1 RND transporter [Magnetococcales bacterium]
MALLLGVAPLVPEPHLLEKLRMLVGGTLRRPLDIFDLLLHSAPLFLLILKFDHWRRSRQA